ncbi:hypothetical protein ASD53_08425 [Lysobacter sp. Root559]|uniref:FHA domain-containing protein n=1 Tax=Lysobacter sp. Root559 TaxID=1736559 RepID=UPI0006FB30AB|nr:FHA domain-containing protein [Lysobacter sp. Root559]KQZ57634.1 hypothetical protein ASD53_08425 [Lysobacter sp. Root559]
MEALRLRYPNREHADLALSPGVHAIGRDADGRTALVGDGGEAVAQVCVDRRGVWLQVREGVRGLHVNGRPVRRMAMLRAGDAIFLDGVELLLLAGEPLPAPADYGFGEAAESRLVIRGIAGPHHGRCYPLDQPRTIGRAGECDIRIDDASFAERHARLEAHADGVVLRDMGSVEGSVVNGRPVRNALLRPGDQLVLESQHRFVIEAPNRGGGSEPAPLAHPAEFEADERARPATALPSSVRRMPWLLLAAALLAAALSLLLLYGAS